MISKALAFIAAAAVIIIGLILGLAPDPVKEAWWGLGVAFFSHPVGIVVLAVALVVLGWAGCHKVVDKESAEGSVTGDQRRGNFNFGSLTGDQIYIEGPLDRAVPLDCFASIENQSIAIQVRPYGQDYEQQAFGRTLVASLRKHGIVATLSSGDYATRHLRGVLVEYAPDEGSETLAQNIRDSLAACRIGADLAGEPIEAWAGQEFVRIGVGMNRNT